MMHQMVQIHHQIEWDLRIGNYCYSLYLLKKPLDYLARLSIWKNSMTMYLPACRNSASKKREKICFKFSLQCQR